MSKTLTREESLLLDIPLYNKVMEVQWKIDKIKKNLSGDLHECKYCSRKYVISCICDEAQKAWNDIIDELKEVSNRNRNNDY